MKDFVSVMKALADPMRIKIVKALETREMCVCEVQAALGVPQSTVSKHLKMLEEAGLVASRREGLWINYYLPAEPGSIYAAQLLVDLKKWFDNHQEVRQLRKILPDIDRLKICGKKRIEQ
jgi:ArsR family transcriptional regulator